MAIERFVLPYSEAAVDDLRERLERTRWPDEIPGAAHVLMRPSQLAEQSTAIIEWFERYRSTAGH